MQDPRWENQDPRAPKRIFSFRQFFFGFPDSGRGSFTSQTAASVPGRFSEALFCLAGRMGDFWLTGRVIGESGVLTERNR